MSSPSYYSSLRLNSLFGLISVLFPDLSQLVSAEVQSQEKGVFLSSSCRTLHSAVGHGAGAYYVHLRTTLPIGSEIP